MKTHQIWFNGRLCNEKSAMVHIHSHGFSRGIVIFEVFGAINTKHGNAVFRLGEHLRRFRKSLEVTGFCVDYTDSELTDIVKTVVNANNAVPGFIKIMAFDPTRTFSVFPDDFKLDVSVYAEPYDLNVLNRMEKPISICISKWKKNHPETVPVEAKISANYLNGILALKDAVNRGFDVGIMTDHRGYVAEGSTESLFMVKDNTLITPSMKNILSGVSRKSIIEAASFYGIKTIEKDITQEELAAADELFTSSTSRKVLPVSKCNDSVFGKVPGTITKKISDIMKNILRGNDNNFRKWFTYI